MGTFHSTQNTGYFGWYIKWNGSFRFSPTGIFRTSFEGGPNWPVWSFQSVGPICPLSFDKIVVPSTPLLYSAYKNNNQTRGGLDRVCPTGMYRSIGQVKLPEIFVEKTGNIVEWKAPCDFAFDLTTKNGTSKADLNNWKIPLTYVVAI